MGRKLGVLWFEAYVDNGETVVRAVHSGPLGRQTLKRGAIPRDDKEAHDQGLTQFIRDSHPKVR